jgi:hypothetical protein
MEIVKTHRGASFKTVEEWLTEADDDIKGAQRDYRAHAYKKALNRLQRAVEVLIKAYALYMGLKSEDELRKDIRHTPIEVYIELLKQSWVVETKNLLRIKSDVNSSIQFLDKIKQNKPTENLGMKASEWDATVPFFLNQYEKINKKYKELFLRKGIRYLLDYCDGSTDTKAYYIAWFGFSALLLPLSASTQFYSSLYTYPDVSRELGIDYKETNLIKNLNRICYLLEENIKLLRTSLKQNKTFSYTLLSETLHYLLPDLTDYYSDEEKLESLIETFGNIKSNNLVNLFSDRIQKSEIVKEAISLNVLSFNKSS